MDATSGGHTGTLSGLQQVPTQAYDVYRVTLDRLQVEYAELLAGYYAGTVGGDEYSHKAAILRDLREQLDALYESQMPAFEWS